MLYDCLLINGDSYSAEIKNKKVYGNFLSESLGIPVKNFAQPGSNNKRILRSTIEYLWQVKEQYQNPLVIIGWSFVRRQEVWYYGNNANIIQKIPDNPDSRLITLDSLLHAKEATLDQKSMILPDSQVHKSLTDFYTDLYLCSHYLKQQKINYFWFSAARNTDCPIHCFPYLMSLKQVQSVSQDQAIFQLHDFCIMNWANENDPDADSVTGHLSENGHLKFANFLLEKLPIDN